MKLSLPLFEALCEIRDPCFTAPDAQGVDAFIAHIRESKMDLLMNRIGAMSKQERRIIISLLSTILGPRYHVTSEWTPHHLAA